MVMLPVVPAIVKDVPVMELVPTFKALTILESEASMASVMPFDMAPLTVISKASSTTVVPPATVSALSRRNKASVFTSPVCEVTALIIENALCVTAEAALLV